MPARSTTQNDTASIEQKVAVGRGDVDVPVPNRLPGHGSGVDATVDGNRSA